VSVSEAMRHSSCSDYEDVMHRHIDTRHGRSVKFSIRSLHKSSSSLHNYTLSK
jgi:hypothetical protein